MTRDFRVVCLVNPKLRLCSISLFESLFVFLQSSNTQPYLNISITHYILMPITIYGNRFFSQGDFSHKLQQIEMLDISYVKLSSSRKLNGMRFILVMLVVLIS